MLFLSSPLIADFFVSLEQERCIPQKGKIMFLKESLCIVYLYIDKIYETE